jgi:ankyrin repeat protein
MIAYNYASELIAAVYKNNRARIKQLVHGQGADINAIGSDGLTNPLMTAVALGDASMMYFLLNHGASPDVCDKNGRTLLMIAISGGNRQIVGSVACWLYQRCPQHINVRTNDNAFSAFDLARHRKQIEFEHTLVSFGARATSQTLYVPR